MTDPQQAQLREALIDTVDNRRFDADYPAGLLYKDIEYVVGLLLPVFAQAARRVEVETAKAIWDDEQKANDALAKLTIGTFEYELMTGRLLGLQRARTIVESQKQAGLERED
jgi:hypothetical protein